MIMQRPTKLIFKKSSCFKLKLKSKVKTLPLHRNRYAKMVFVRAMRTSTPFMQRRNQVPGVVVGIRQSKGLLLVIYKRGLPVIYKTRCSERTC